MTRARVAAAAAAILTALLLQATIVGPVSNPFAVSLPAVLVAAVALVDGPATGMSFGFTVGLVADLGSQHPAGVLALCWLLIGLVGGTFADRRSLPRDALTAGIVCGLGTSAATVLLTIVHSGGTLSAAVLHLLPVAAGDAVLAFAVIAIVRRMLHNDSLRAPHPVFTDLATSARRG